jgi:leucyl/phenylalanyl-tRNA--protein transferase
MPDPRRAPDHGLVAAGGDLAPGTVLAAYRAGIFPWPDTDGRLFWFSPNPRAIIPLDGFHESRRLRRRRRQGRLLATRDRDFAGVVDGCATAHGATWITPEMRAAYTELHDLGWAHSIEVWAGDVLAGGVYGVTVGGLFAAESMFHHEPDASKVALAELVAHLGARGFALLDVQLATPHLTSLGAVEIVRDEYLARLQEALRTAADWTA